MSWRETAVSLVQRALGVAETVAPGASVTTTVGGAAVTISPATLRAGLAALGKIPWSEIEAEFNVGQIVTAGVMLADDATAVIDKFVPSIIPVEKLLDFAVVVGTHSLAHNSGDGGIGARPEGTGSVP